MEYLNSDNYWRSFNVLFSVHRNMLLEKELQQMLWRIDFNDLKFTKKEKGSIVSETELMDELIHFIRIILYLQLILIISFSVWHQYGNEYW